MKYEEMKAYIFAKGATTDGWNDAGEVKWTACEFAKLNNRVHVLTEHGYYRTNIMAKNCAEACKLLDESDYYKIEF